MSETTRPANGLSIKEQITAMVVQNRDLTGVDWSDMEAALGSNADKYRPLWDRMVSGKKGFMASMSPCWTAIPFLGVHWAVARRNYINAAFLLVVLVVMNLFLTRVEDTAKILAVSVAVSFTYKHTHLQWLAAKIQNINRTGVTGEARMAAIRQMGGLDLKGGAIAFGVLLLISIGLRMLG